jgi:uncharacterized membrane protein YkvA (DUF1232 family)
MSEVASALLPSWLSVAARNRRSVSVTGSGFAPGCRVVPNDLASAAVQAACASNERAAERDAARFRSRIPMMKIEIELSDKDLRYFRKCLKTVKQGEHATDESVVLASAAELMREVVAAEAPEFVHESFRKLQLLVDMLEDEEWRLTGPDRARVLNVLTYFVDPDDLIPDRIPGIGYLDDAIMVQLVVEQLHHEIEAFEKFCEIRKTKKPDAAAMAKSRSQLQARMRRNRRQERSRRRSRGGGRSPIGLW